MVITTTRLGSEIMPRLQCCLPTGGGFVFNFRAIPISAGVDDFSQSSRELELEPHSLLSLETAMIAAISTVLATS